MTAERPQAPPPGPPAPEPTQRPYRKLYRSNSDRKLGGVSAGLAEFLGLDPTIVRLATFLLAFTGIGILVYIAAWIVVPERPAGQSQPMHAPLAPSDRNLNVALGIAAIALAVGIISGSWALLAFALVGGGVWLLSEQGGTTAAAVTPEHAVATDYGPSGEPLRWQSDDAPLTATDTGYVPPAPVWNEPVNEPRKPQRITWIVLSILALIVAVAIAASTGNWWNVSATRTLGLGLVVIGVGVVAGVVNRGGARGLLPLGIIAALALFPVSAVDGLVDEGVGETSFRPASLAELQTSYEHGVGQMTVDLSNIELNGVSRSVDIDLGIGDLTVIVPRSVGGTARIDANVGEVAFQNGGLGSVQFDDGINVGSGVVRLPGDDGELTLDIDVGLGKAELRFERN